jgi:hypothetical protein
MITRRKFLIGAGSVLTLPLLNMFTWHLENMGVPLIEAPAQPKNVIYVSAYMDYQLNLNEFPDKIPSITWREFLFEKLGYSVPKHRRDFRRIYDEWGVMPHQFDDECEDYVWEPYWCRVESPNALAYDLLDRLEIGRELTGPGEAAGGLQFVDGPMPGSDYLGVHADDELSVSLLQHRLNELGTGIAIEMIE